MVYLDYTKDRKVVLEILRAMVKKRPGYSLLKTKMDGELDDLFPWELGADIFLSLNHRGDDPLGWDIGYSSVADMLWLAGLRGHLPNALEESIAEHILNMIPDISIRSLACERIKQATGISIPHSLIMRDI